MTEDQIDYKPIKLLEYLTNENEIVLDNCMGSGSTAIVGKVELFAC